MSLAQMSFVTDSEKAANASLHPHVYRYNTEISNGIPIAVKQPDLLD